MLRSPSALLFLLFGLALPTLPLAQEAKPTVIEAGSKLIEVRALPAHSATYVLYRGSGADRVAMQEIRRELVRVDEAGEACLRLAWHTQAMGREVVDELWLDPQTLAPLGRVVPLPTGGVARLTIEGDTVTGELTDGDGQVTEQVDVGFTTELHDASLPLLASLPLKPGAAFRLPTLPLDLGATPAEPSWMKITVGEHAPFEIAAGIELDAWVIELVPEAGGPRTRLWLAEEEPFLLRKEIALPGYGEIVWELKTED